MKLKLNYFTKSFYVFGLFIFGNTIQIECDLIENRRMHVVIEQQPHTD